MSSAITGLIDGTTTVEEAMSTMFKNIGQAFIDMATQMIAKALVMKALGILFLAPVVEAEDTACLALEKICGGHRMAETSTARRGLYRRRPRTGGVDGKADTAILHPQETVRPRHGALQPGQCWRCCGRSRGHGCRGGAATDAPMSITINGGVTQIGNDEYIRKDQREIVAQASKAGEARTMRRLQMNPGARRKLECNDQLRCFSARPTQQRSTSLSPFPTTPFSTGSRTSI